MIKGFVKLNFKITTISANSWNLCPKKQYEFDLILKKYNSTRTLAD